MTKRKSSPRKWSFILAMGRENHHFAGMIYWFHHNHKFNIMMSNRKEFEHNYKLGYCTFTFHQLNQLYNFIRKHCGYHTLSVAKKSRVAKSTLERKLAKN